MVGHTSWPRPAAHTCAIRITGSPPPHLPAPTGHWWGAGPGTPHTSRGARADERPIEAGPDRRAHHTPLWWGGGRASRGCSSPAAFSRWVASPLYAYIQPYTAIACRAIERAAYLRVAICPAPLSRISFLWFSYPALSSAGPSSHHRRHPPPPASGCLSVLSPPPARISRCLGDHRRFALTRARDYRPHRPCLRSAAAAGPVVAADGARCLRCVVGG